MSFDFIILKPEQELDAVSALDEVELVYSLGSACEVYAYLSTFFSRGGSGYWLGENGEVIEIMEYEDNSQALHLSLQFGQNWSDSMSDDFMDMLKVMCAPKGWAAFSDNERIA